jgi:type IX secretion system PorP/SprF family membrane protein
MIKKFYYAVLLIIGVSVGLQGQDLHFSQFYAAPLDLNPAMTGVMDCNIRFNMNYRNQWSSVLRSNAFNTFAASYDQKFPVGRSDNFGFGATVWGDRAGSLDFSTVKGMLSFGFSKKLGGGRNYGHYLTAGVAVGIQQRNVDFLKAEFGSQYNPALGGFDPNRDPLELFENGSVLYPDVNAGLMWYSVFDENNSVYVGAAFNHITRPNERFLTSDTEIISLYTKYTFHAGAELARPYSKVSLLPGMVTMFQGPAFQVNGGSSVRFLLENSRWSYQAFQIGAWMRLSNHFDNVFTGDAFILSTRVDYNQFSLGFSYDFNVSPLSVASNGNGGFEFSLQYLICGPEKRGVYCPKF